jgi:hypothetical protein
VNLDTYDGFLEALLAAGVGRAAAERMALAKYPKVIVTPSEAALHQKIEDEHVAAGDDLMRALGFEVVCFSQKKRAKVTPGIPDRRYYRRPRKIELLYPLTTAGTQLTSLFFPITTIPAITLWWEAKSETGEQRPDQRAFQEMVEACGEVYLLGKLEVLKQWLVDNRIATRSGELFEPIQIPSSAA